MWSSIAKGIFLFNSNDSTNDPFWKISFAFFRCFRFSFPFSALLVESDIFDLFNMCVCSCVYIRIQFYVSKAIAFKSCAPWHSFNSIIFLKEEGVEGKKAERVDKIEFPWWPIPTNTVASQISRMFYDFTDEMQRCSLSLLTVRLVCAKECVEYDY